MPFLSASGVSPYNKIRGGGSALVVPFAFENALEFDGVNDYVSIPAITLSNSSNSWALSFWATNAGVGFLGYSGDAKYLQTVADGRVIFNPGVAFTNPARTNGIWHNFFITGINGTWKCFVDGVESTNGTQSNTSSLVFDQIGKRSTDYINSNVDEFAFWENTGGTAQNAIDIYNGGAGQYANLVIPSPTRSYRLNGSGADTIAVDSSGNGNNGTLTNFPTSGMWVGHYRDDSARAIISRMTSNGSTPSESRQTIINQLVLDLKGIGNTGSGDIWSILDVMQIYAAEDSIQGKTEWIKADGTLDATEVNTPTFITNVGYESTSTGCIDTNFQPATNGVNYTLNSASAGFFSFDCTFKFLYGENGNSNSSWARQRNAGFVNSAFNSVNAVSGYSQSRPDNLKTFIRQNSTKAELWIDDVNNGYSSGTSTSIGTVYSFYFLGMNRASPVITSGVKGSLFYAGGDLSSHMTQLTASFNAYLNSI